jgi:hypothetical protein
VCQVSGHIIDNRGGRCSLGGNDSQHRLRYRRLPGEGIDLGLRLAVPQPRTASTMLIPALPRRAVYLLVIC